MEVLEAPEIWNFRYLLEYSVVLVAVAVGVNLQGVCTLQQADLARKAMPGAFGVSKARILCLFLQEQVAVAVGLQGGDWCCI